MRNVLIAESWSEFNGSVKVIAKKDKFKGTVKVIAREVEQFYFTCHLRSFATMIVKPMVLAKWTRRKRKRR